MLMTTISSWALLVSKALQARGINSHEIFVQAGLDPRKLDDPNARYPIKGMQTLWSLSAQATNDPCFGLEAVRYWHPTTLHALGYSWLASASLKDALERAVRYVHIVTTALDLTLEQDVKEVCLSLETQSPEVAPVPESIDAGLALIVHLCRLSGGEDFAPLRVTMCRAAPSCVEKFHDYFRAPITFDAVQDTLVFSRLRIERELPTSNTQLAHANDQIITAYLANLNQGDVAMRLKKRLIDMMSSGDVSGDTVAQAMHLSPRSLQRKLQARGLTYSQVLDDTRRELAAQYIKNSGLSLSEITFLLGFSEPSNFSRAFKRWTGCTPSEYRMAN